MHLRPLLPGFGRHLSAHGAASRTIASYTRTTEAFFDVVGERSPSPAIVEDFLARIGARGKSLASSTKRGELMALRAFFRYAAREHAIADPTHGIRVKRERRDRPAAVVMPEEITPLFEATARSREPRRDSAIVGLMFVLGLRVHEVVALDVGQVDLLALVVRKVRGKGGTVTDFPIPTQLAEILAAWIRARAMIAGENPALFPTARPSSSRTGRLSVRSMQRLIARLAIEAGLDRAIGPHALRHACGTAAIRLGVDVATTARVMRHANIATTSIYIHVADDDRATPIAKLASMIPPSALPLASTGLGAQPPVRNHAENGLEGGVLPPVDIQPLLDDILRPDRDVSAPEKALICTPDRACFRSRASRREPPLAEGGSRGEGRLEELLAHHLAAIEALVDAKLGALDQHPRGRARLRRLRGLRSGGASRDVARPVDPLERTERDRAGRHHDLGPSDHVGDREPVP